MVTRILPPSEWTRLDPETVRLPAVDRAAVDADILVVEDQGQIVGCWTVMTCVHVEGCWIDPRYRRKVAVGRRLWTAMKALVQQRGAHGALMCAVTDESRTRIAKTLHGIEVLGTHFAVTLNG